MKIIIGLGNPGEKYKRTRHNVGFMAVDAIAEKLNLSWKENKKFKALVAETADLILIKPETFMNNSGQSAQAVLSYYKLLPKKLGILKLKNADLSEILTVIHDEIDLPLGKYKISVNSRSAGHNGVQSIINYLKTKNFKRIRMGIKPETENRIETIKLVMQNFTKEELGKIKNNIEQISENILK